MVEYLCEICGHKTKSMVAFRRHVDSKVTCLKKSTPNGIDDLRRYDIGRIHSTKNKISDVLEDELPGCDTIEQYNAIYKKLKRYVNSLDKLQYVWEDELPYYDYLRTVKLSAEKHKPNINKE